MKVDTNADRTFPFNRAANFIFRPELDSELRITPRKQNQAGFLNKNQRLHAMCDQAGRKNNQTQNSFSN